MKLLLDENLSRRLVPFLQQDYPGTDHVVMIGLESASDRQVRDRARLEDFVIVTRDADFCEMSSVFGQPPRWFAFGRRTSQSRLHSKCCSGSVR